MAWNTVTDPFGFSSPGSLVPFTSTTGRTSTSAALDGGERTFIAIIDGQSLAANHSQAAYTVTNSTKVQCVNWASDRLIYRHVEPMMGGSFYAAGHEGFGDPYISIWGKVGDLLIDGDIFDRVIWCNVAAGGITAANLAPGGSLGRRIPAAFHVLSSLGFRGNRVDAILSMLGESDAAGGTTKANFQLRRRATIRASRSYGFTGPWFIAEETYVEGVTSSTIQDAQTEMVGADGVVAGPSFDDLGSSYRWDDIHQDQDGHDEFATRWFNTLAAHYG